MHASGAAVLVALMGIVVPTGVLRSVTEIALFALGITAVSCALREHRTPSVAAWRGLAAALGFFAFSTAAEIPTALGATSSVFPLVESGLDIAAYAALVVAALAQLAAGRRRRDREAWADTTSLVLAAGLVFLAFSSSNVGGQVSETQLGAPVVTALVLVVCVPLAVPDNGRSVSAMALLGAGLLAAVGYGGRFVAPSLEGFALIDELPQLAVACLILAGRHPSVARLGTGAASATRVTTGRLLGLGAALLISPVLLLLVGVQDGGAVGYLLAAGSALLTGVALWRLASMNRQREAARTELVASQTRLELLLANSADVIGIVDAAGVITYMSPAVESLLGRPAADYVGRTAIELADPRDQGRLRDVVAAAGDAAEGGFADTDIRVRHSSGSARWVEMRISGQVEAAGIEGWVVNLREVTDRKLFEDELRRQATTDPLTGLLNRAAFNERLAAATALVDASATPAVLFVDVDDFKAVNDTLGHGAGDELLLAVAARLSEGVRGEDVVARLGGDEFALLLPGADAERLREVADRLLAAVRTPLDIDGHPVSVSASIGGALAGPGCDAERLLHRADTAMYTAKRAGKNACALLDTTEAALL